MPERAHRLSQFEFDVPLELIAKEPVEALGLDRDESRLLVICRREGKFMHRKFRDMADLLRPEDVLVLNDSRVMNSLLDGTDPRGAAVTLNIFSPSEDGTWHCLVRPARAGKTGLELRFEDGLGARLIDRVDERVHLVSFSDQDLLMSVLAAHGRPSYSMYVKEPSSFEQYQTVYGYRPGSTELPAAGRHFTPRLLEQIAAQGTAIVYLTLHVGVSSLPVEVEDYSRHRMLPEWYEVSTAAADLINRRRREGGRVMACGTTCVRTLETVTGQDGIVRPGTGWADLFIYPGYRFRAADAIISNFHQPKSTRILLVAAFAGPDLILSAYEEAVRHRYRFYEFGDTTVMI